MALKDWKLIVKAKNFIMWENKLSKEHISLTNENKDSGWNFGDLEDPYIKHHDLKSDALAFAKKYMGDN